MRGYEGAVVSESGGPHPQDGGCAGGGGVGPHRRLLRPSTGLLGRGELGHRRAQAACPHMEESQTEQQAAYCLHLRVTAFAAHSLSLPTAVPRVSQEVYEDGSVWKQNAGEYHVPSLRKQTTDVVTQEMEGEGKE